MESDFVKFNEEWINYLRLMRERPELFQDDNRLKIVTNLEVVDDFEKKTGKKIGVVYQSEYHLFVVDLVEDTEGHRFAYERLVPAVRKGAVVSIPIYKGKMVLLRQFRHALRSVQYAFPRGFGEEGILVEENLRKEIKEEIGAEVYEASRLGVVIADSGITNNPVEVFVCDISEPQLKKCYEGIEQVVLISVEELEEWIAQGMITDGYTLSGYMLYKCKK